MADPYPHFVRLRQEAPVLHLRDLDVWVLSRYDDVALALRDSERFSSDLRRLTTGLAVNPFNPTMRVPRPLRPLTGRLPWSRVLLTSDPPDHTVLRKKASRAFAPRLIEVWEARVREISERLVDDLAAGLESGPADLVSRVASPLPTTVIAEMMGIPSERHADFKRWSDHLTDGLVATGSLRNLVVSAIQIQRFFGRVVRERRTSPGDDLVSLLLSGDAETALTRSELRTSASCCWPRATRRRPTSSRTPSWRIALETLFRRLPDLHVAGTPTRIDSPVLRGLRSLPVAASRGV